MLQRTKRRAKLKKTIRGTGEKPRLVVFRSNKYIYGQLVDDAKGVTLASVDRIADPVKAGTGLGEKAHELKIKTVVFDRAGYHYHGKIKAFADAVRATGVEF